MIPQWAIDRAALPVWYKEQCERVSILQTSMESITDPDISEAMRQVVEIHRARARVLERIMAEALGK